MPNKKCEQIVEKPYHKPSSKNLTGTTWRRCGLVVIAVSVYGKPLCKRCAKLHGVVSNA
jgi:hypothetical protein